MRSKRSTIFSSRISSFDIASISPHKAAAGLLDDEIIAIDHDASPLGPRTCPIVFELAAPPSPARHLDCCSREPRAIADSGRIESPVGWAKRSVPTLPLPRGHGAKERAFAHPTGDSIRSKSALDVFRPAQLTRPGRTAARSDAVQNRDRSKLRCLERSRVCSAPLRANALRAALRPGHEIPFDRDML
jgi:hypothetical protein